MPLRAGDVLLTSTGSNRRKWRTLHPIAELGALARGSSVSGARPRFSTVVISTICFAVATSASSYWHGQREPLFRGSGSPNWCRLSLISRRFQSKKPSLRSSVHGTIRSGQIERAIYLLNQFLDSSAEKVSATLPGVPLAKIVAVSRTVRSPKDLADADVDHFSLPAFDRSLVAGACIGGGNHE